MFISILVIVYCVVVLAVAYALKKYQRTILWSAGLLLFIVTMLLFGLGIMHPKNLYGIWDGCFPLICSGVILYVAESKHQLQVKNVIKLPDKLNTELAMKVFNKALEDEFLKVEKGKLKWKKSTALLAYMCGRIYCGDFSQYYKRENCYRWKWGDEGRFPTSLLESLFDTKNIGQSRQNGKNDIAPDGSVHVDSWFN